MPRSLAARTLAPAPIAASAAASLLRHASLAQTDEKSGAPQGSDLRHPEISDGHQTADARITVIVDQPPRFGELGGAALTVSLQPIGRGKMATDEREPRTGAARLFEPDDRLVGARLKQMRQPNRIVPKAEVGITRTEAD